jgi:hypothetical protein
MCGPCIAARPSFDLKVLVRRVQNDGPLVVSFTTTITVDDDGYTASTTVDLLKRRAL